MRWIKSNRGFTLLEVIVSFGILSMIFIMFIGLFSKNTFIVKASGDNSQSLYRVESLMDYIYTHKDIQEGIYKFPDEESLRAFIMDDRFGPGKVSHNIFEADSHYPFRLKVTKKAFMENLQGWDVTIVHFYKEDAHVILEAIVTEDQ